MGTRVNQFDYSKSILKMTEATSRFWADSVRGWGFPAFVKVSPFVSLSGSLKYKMKLWEEFYSWDPLPGGGVLR